MLDDYELHNMILEIGAPGRTSLISGERGRGKPHSGSTLQSGFDSTPRIANCVLTKE